MSLYNLLHGMNPLTDLYLAMIGLSRDRVPRFRDVYLFEMDGDQGYGIAVHTRTGGGNRDYYESEESCQDNYPEYFDGTDAPPEGPWNSDLQANALYLRDEDDDFDRTYATFFFRAPAAYQEQIGELVALGGQTNVPADQWKRVFAKLADLKSGDVGDKETQDWMEGVRPIVQEIVEALGLEQGK